MARIQKIKGFNDLFPEQSAKYALMEQRAREVFGRYGFGELRVPVLERTELFARSIGEDTDVVGKEMFSFPDRRGRSMTLRPEATAGVVRAFVDSGLHQPGRVSRYYTFGPMFRYERPQMGRQRQFHQINAETFGAAEPQADAETLLMLAAFLGSLGLDKLSFELNTLGCAECRPAYREALTGFFGSLDLSALCEDCRRRVKTNPLRVLDCKVPGCRDLVKDAPAVSSHVCAGCRAHFEAVLEMISAAGLKHSLNSRLVRGLDYYQRTTFEVCSGEIGAQSAVAGGGRYDGLVAALGGPDVPGIGFACGMDRLAMLLDPVPDPEPDFYLAVLDSRAEAQAALLAQRLRERGLGGELGYGAASLKSRLRQANKNRARTCLIIGLEEFEAGTVLVKDMTGHGQESVGRETLLDKLDRFFPSPSGPGR
ncbi:MAG: histidine--tRNA ligase [Desulfovibrionaceae bacterium]|nr:histidine--tRNA ligase [Desulfovibrionaceae bacterium]